MEMCVQESLRRFWLGMKKAVCCFLVALYIGHWQRRMTCKEAYSGFIALLVWRAPT